MTKINMATSMKVHIATWLQHKSYNIHLQKLHAVIITPDIHINTQPEIKW